MAWIELYNTKKDGVLSVRILPGVVGLLTKKRADVITDYCINQTVKSPIHSFLPEVYCHWKFEKGDIIIFRKEIIKK